MRTKKIITMLFIAALAMGASAQDLGKAYDSSDIYQKINVSAAAIKVRGDQKLVLQTLQDLLKQDKLKGKVSKNLLQYEKVSFPAISNDYLNLYFSIKEIGKQDGETVSIVSAFVSRGANAVFVSPNDDEQLFNNLKQFLENRFYPQMQSAFVQNQTKNQNAVIKDTEKQISALESKIKGREKDIKTAQDNIVKYQKEIDDSKNELQNQNNLLNQQKDALRNIK